MSETLYPMGPGSVAAGGPSHAEAPADIRAPEFSPLTAESATGKPSPINRFFDIQVTVSAELGRVTMSLGQLVELGEGSVLELNRAISSPIELMAQGVRIATGEVVVIDDCFAIRIKDIDAANKVT
jgi:flagellar motor switch protein FliN/FliY